MDINKTKLGLIYIFSESKKVPKKAKLQLINFIESANIHQLKVLAMDGEIIPKTVFDEVTKKIIEDRFNTMPHLTKSLNRAALEAMQIMAL